MRKLSIAIAVATGFAATPAMACSMMGQAANATPATAAASPMMCGASTTAAPAQAPGPGAASAQPNQSAAGGGCPCCRNMAMMQPRAGQPGGMGSMPGLQNEMPGMQGAPAPEALKPN